MEREEAAMAIGDRACSLTTVPCGATLHEAPLQKYGSCGRRSVGAVGFVALFGILLWHVFSSGGWSFVFGEPLVAFDRELRGRTLHPFWQLPAYGPEQRHDRRYEHTTDDGRIDRDRHGHPQAELLDGGVTVYHEGVEDGDRYHRRRGDHTRRRGKAVDDGLVRIVRLLPLHAG